MITESLDSTECMNGKQRPRWYFLYVHDDLFLHILHMSKGTFSLEEAHFVFFMRILRRISEMAHTQPVKVRTNLGLQSFVKIFTTNAQGPVVQSIIGLKSLLMTNSLTVVAKVFSNTMIFACKSYSNFAAKISMYLPYFKIEILMSC